MALDLHKTARQVGAMASGLQASHARREKRLRAALRTMDRPLERPQGAPLAAEVFRRRFLAAAARRVTWLAAEPLGSPGGSLGPRFPAPPALGEYAVLATDGSQIEADRHGPAHCFLINIGGAALQYGAHPAAQLFSEPRLFSAPEELAIRDPEGGPREQAIDGALLGLKRSVMECQALAARAPTTAPDLPLVALLDGSLVLFELSGERYPEFVARHVLDEGLLPALDALRGLARSRPLALGSYVSRPRSTEVVNLLRLAHCPHEGLEAHGCDRFCGKGGPGRRECDDVALGLMDRDLFEDLLGPGERSIVFASQSLIVRRYGRHRVCFFYLNAGEEIARVEFPEWVADDPAGLDLLQGALLDQCRKGMGYPVALQEAHERAVVTMADRRAFWGVVEAALRQRGVDAGGSLKARSKRVRAV